MELKFQQILSNWKKGEFQPVYFLFGEEEYFIDELVRFAEKKILNEGEQAFNQTVLYGKEINYQNVLDSAYQFPMMSKYRVVIVKEAQTMRDLNKLEGYFEKPSEQTILVLAHKHKKLDKRKKVWKAISKSAVTFESKKVYENKMGSFISNFLKTQKLTINPVASQLIVTYLGTNLSKVVNELSKLSINQEPGSVITENDVQEQIGVSKDYNVFEFINALGAKDSFKAFRIAKYFGDNPKNNPLPVIMSNLLSFYQKVAMVKEFGNLDSRKLAEKIGVNFYFVDQYKSAARYYSSDDIRNAFSILRSTDLKSKGIGSVNAKPDALLKELVSGLTH